MFLHGGLGGTHDYLRPVAQQLAKNYRCVLFDQRGNGKSEVSPLNESTINLGVFMDDISIIQEWLGAEKLILVGHSWGAMLALFYNLKFPTKVKANLLVSMGPLDSEFEKLSSDCLLHSLTSEEKTRWQELREHRNYARDKGDIDNVQIYDRKLMELRVKSWIFHESLREKFLESYFEEPPPNRLVNMLVWNSIRGRFCWNDLKTIENPIWLCHGEGDLQPVAQGDKFKKFKADVKISVIPKCGHVPWFDEPILFYSQLNHFLQGQL